MSRKIIIGCGTGRCGTLSLSELLSSQENAIVSHEMKPGLHWDFHLPDYNRMLTLFHEANAANVGDVAMYWLNYIPSLLADYEDVAVICLKRDKSNFIDSWLRWVNHRNEFLTMDSFGKHLPNYPLGLKMRDYLSQYYDMYYDTISMYQRADKRVHLFPTQALNTKEGVHSILEAAQIENKVITHIHSHQSEAAQ